MALQLVGAGLGADALDTEIDGFLLKAPNPSATDVSNFLKLYPKGQREEVSRRLIARGVTASAVSGALTWLDAADSWGLSSPSTRSTLWGIASIASGAASAYHGYKRNNSIGWGVWWFIMGSMFPVITPVIGLAQGFGKRKAA